MTAKPKELREYDSAILQHMEDGRVYLRDELMRVGCSAIDPHYALSMYQQKHGGRINEMFEGLTQEQRVAEIERQRHEGAKLQVGKRLSHLESGGLIEVVEWGEPRPGRKLKQRISFKITDRGLQRLMGASDEEIDEGWTQEARDALIEVAQTKQAFTVDTIWALPLARPLSKTHAPLEPILMWGIGQGFCLPTDDSVPRADNSGGSVRVYESLIFGKVDITWKTCGCCGHEVDPTEPGTSKVQIYNWPVGESGQSRTSGTGRDPFAPEPTGEHWCKTCTQVLRNTSGRMNLDIRQKVRELVLGENVRNRSRSRRGRGVGSESHGSGHPDILG